MFAEIKNDFFFGPFYGEERDEENEGLFGGVSIDGWKTDDDDESGEVIANVLLTTEGKLIVDWHNNGARMNEEVLEAIKEAAAELKKDFAEAKEKKNNDR